MDYLSQLNTAEWRAKKRRILRRDKYACTRCRRRHLQLHVHHLRYPDHPAMAWDVPDSWLTTLCQRCHALEHDKLPARRALLAPNHQTGR